MLTYDIKTIKARESVRQAERKINLRPYLIWVMPTEGSNKNTGASSGIGRRVYFFCMIGNIHSFE